jgi:hypothetical protein
LESVVRRGESPIPPAGLFLGLAGLEVLVAVCRALLETAVTVRDIVASGHALGLQMAARYLAALKFFGALVDIGCEHHHQAAEEREERQTCFTFHARILQISTALV